MGSLGTRLARHLLGRMHHHDRHHHPPLLRATNSPRHLHSHLQRAHEVTRGPCADATPRMASRDHGGYRIWQFLVFLDDRYVSFECRPIQLQQWDYWTLLFDWRCWSHRITSRYKHLLSTIFTSRIVTRIRSQSHPHPNPITSRSLSIPFSSSYRYL